VTAVRSDRTRGTRWVETIALFTTGLYAKSSLIPSQIDEIRPLRSSTQFWRAECLNWGTFCS
jgi:hypothetical protein